MSSTKTVIIDNISHAEVKNMLIKWQETKYNQLCPPSSGTFSSVSSSLLFPSHELHVLLAIHVCLLFVQLAVGNLHTVSNMKIF